MLIAFGGYRLFALLFGTALGLGWVPSLGALGVYGFWIGLSLGLALVAGGLPGASIGAAAGNASGLSALKPTLQDLRLYFPAHANFRIGKMLSEHALLAYPSTVPQQSHPAQMGLVNS